MNDSVFSARSPGEMLRAAREKQGLHIAALAAAIKVAPRKLDALEHDRWDELPDATFVRALAQTVCRTLKIDAAPVLLLLPRGGALTLEPGSGGLNEPFRERSGRDESRLSFGAVRPMVVAASLLMAAAVAVYFVPEQFWQGQLNPPSKVDAKAGAPSKVAAPEGGSALAESNAGNVVVEPVPIAASAPMVAASTAVLAAPVATVSGLWAKAPITVSGAALSAQTIAASTGPSVTSPGMTGGVASPTEKLAPGTGSGPVQLAVRETSWVEVRDANGRTLLSRQLSPGERVGLDGALPMRLTIGNAAGTQLVFRGQAFDLATATRDNVARVELK